MGGLYPDILDLYTDRFISCIMEIQQLADILKRYGTGECTEAEKLLVEAWYDELVNTGELQWDEEKKARLKANMQQRLLQNITDEETQSLHKGRIRFIQRKWWWAAAVLILLAGGTYFFLNKPKNESRVVKTNPGLQNDVAPGGNKAVLTLANGTTISLNDAANGTLANEGSSVVSKTKDGELEYKPADRNSVPVKPGAIGFNTLATPKGGQYQLVLPDGSKVWLNAASSIRYPTAFAGAERRVAITGEAYFEVVHNSKMPFKVEKGNMTVEVLGTHFNINAYEDEAEMKTTLLEGSVKVTKGAESALLKPGQQVIISQSSHLSHPIPVQTDEVMAWKNGLFHFEHADLKTVMRQLARWYDVDIVYKDPNPKSDPLFMDMSRNANLSDVLKALEVSGSARFSIEGKKIIVL
jgi:transmembrane sensor